jgi:hypothetical protein
MPERWLNVTDQVSQSLEVVEPERSEPGGLADVVPVLDQRVGRHRTALSRGEHEPGVVHFAPASALRSPAAAGASSSSTSVIDRTDRINPAARLDPGPGPTSAADVATRSRRAGAGVEVFQS